MRPTTHVPEAASYSSSEPEGWASTAVEADGLAVSEHQVGVEDILVGAPRRPLKAPQAGLPLQALDVALEHELLGNPVPVAPENPLVDRGRLEVAVLDGQVHPAGLAGLREPGGHLLRLGRRAKIADRPDAEPQKLLAAALGQAPEVARAEKLPPADPAPAFGLVAPEIPEIGRPLDEGPPLAHERDPAVFGFKAEEMGAGRDRGREDDAVATVHAGDGRVVRERRRGVPVKHADAV